MRLLAYALVFACLAFFGWAAWIDRSPRNLGVPVTAKLPQLQLSPSHGGVGASGGVPGSSTQRCRTIGPYTNTSIAKAAMDALAGKGFAPRLRGAKSITSDGFWVYLADVTTAGAQHHALETLKGSGMHDAKVVSEPNQPVKISIGVFADQAAAAAKADAVKKLGFNPMVDLHQHVTDTLWLDTDMKPGQVEPPSTEIPGGGIAHEGNVEVEVEFTDCPAPGSSG